MEKDCVCKQLTKRDWHTLHAAEISEGFRDKDFGYLVADLLPWNGGKLPGCLFNRKLQWMFYATFSKNHRATYSKKSQVLVLLHRSKNVNQVP